ncbi:peptide/nickel transport system substrate-binding protein [Saccharothrix tamanrassetensis]|uniref:Peptide/nickel transport system substrate-binding protein n=1 Tax=Saccharothrix tamanrassetensis TaxID=1051531 RepID=A0A841CI15_9PSEU|nr:ABC transporter substrate-binding protein [Saccharothrix tamanrassetensis]MBB5955767.1 peptide/nickel transport system substrate-binding protein [Saccharothrix tamanrassetensis]
MRPLLPPLVLVAVLAAAGCTGGTTPNAEGTADGSSIVLADAAEPATLNPLLGYGREGVSKIYDGLVEHRADRSLRPQLAADLPKPSADGLSWTVRLRDGVKFTDGSSFGPEDVVATYRALLDPAAGSTERPLFGSLTGVEQLDVHTVRFALAKPWAAFPHLLALGVLPSEALAVPLKDVKPVGTGPYKLAEWRKGDRMVLESNPAHFAGEPAIRKLTVVFVPDDNTRAQRMQAGEFDGAELPPRLAEPFGGTSGMRVVTHRSTDLRAVTLPTADPVTGDPAVRMALNHAVNRKSVVDNLLGGKGTPAATPIPDTMPEFHDPAAIFAYDKALADLLLDQAGWTRGEDGVRARNGVPARFTLMYPIGDVVRADLATAFVADARAVGVDVQLAGLSWEAISPRLGRDALLHGGGTPFDPDLTAHQPLHTGNPWGYTNSQVDAALDTGRTLLDPAQRTAAYRQFQHAYLAAPGMVVLAAVQHVYVLRDNWTGYQDVVDPHTHGALSWGPWWNLEKWKAR